MPRAVNTITYSFKFVRYKYEICTRSLINVICAFVDTNDLFE